MLEFRLRLYAPPRATSSSGCEALYGEAAKGIGDAPGEAAKGIGDAPGKAAKGIGDAPVVQGDRTAEGDMTVTTAEDVGDVVMLECGTVRGDSVATAILLNEVCGALEKETGRKVSRVVHAEPVDASAPILSLRLKKSEIRCKGKPVTPADVPKLVRALTK